MRHSPALVIALTASLLAVSAVSLRAQAEGPAPPTRPAAPQEGTPAQPPQEEKLAPHERTRREAAKLVEQAGEKVKDFAQYADGYLKKATSSPLIGWVVLAVGSLIGALSLFFGWTFVQWLLVPSAPLLGLATGGFTAFCVIQALYTNRPTWFRLTLLAVGVAIGIAVYLFTALKAKPVAAFLVIMSPFMMLAAFLFPYSAVMGLVIFCIGFLAGFAAMIEVRPLSIIATSVLGGCALVATWGLLSHLLHGQPPFVRDVFEWLMANPDMLAIAWGALVFIGVCFQFATGPRGGLEA